MHDLIFANQKEMNLDKYVEYAGQIGLNVQQFRTDLTSPAVRKRLDDDKKEAASLGVTGTPGFFVNGRFLSGAKPFEAFKTVIDEELGRG